MSKYGLPLMVAAGMLLAAALGVVAGVHWAGERGRTVGPGDGVAEGVQHSVAVQGSQRRGSLPRFLTAEPDPSEAAPAEAGAATERSRRGRRARASTGAFDESPPAPRSEVGSEGAPPSPAAVARAREVRATLESAVAAYPGVRVRFADCSSGSCVARVESGEAAPIDRLIRDKQRLPPGFKVRAHERLTAFNGRIFEADFVEEGRRPD